MTCETSWCEGVTAQKNSLLNIFCIHKIHIYNYIVLLILLFFYLYIYLFIIIIAIIINIILLYYIYRIYPIPTIPYIVTNYDTSCRAMFCEVQASLDQVKTPKGRWAAAEASTAQQSLPSGNVWIIYG